MCYNSRIKEARAEHKPYPTDLTDAQWSEIEPLYSGMRNRKWSKRELTNAVLYIVKTGCQWRQLPHDFPPYQTVYSFFSRGAKSGLWEEILAHLVEKTRKDAGKSAEPHYALIDSQSVKTVADNEKRGIDGGKKAKGRKRHAVIDTMGNLLGIVVHAANIHDTKSGILAAQKACKKYPSIQAFCADAGYRGTCIDEVKVTPHNSAARLAMSFPPSAACKFLDLHPVNLRNLHLHLTKNPFASRPPHLYGVTLIRGGSSKTLFFSFLLNFIPFLLKRSDEFINCHFLIDIVCDNARLIQVTNKLCIREARNAIVHHFLA